MSHCSGMFTVNIPSSMVCQTGNISPLSGAKRTTDCTTYNPYNLWILLLLRPSKLTSHIISFQYFLLFLISANAHANSYPRATQGCPYRGVALYIVHCNWHFIMSEVSLRYVIITHILIVPMSSRWTRMDTELGE